MSGHPVIAEVSGPVVAAVQNDAGVIVGGLEDLVLLELRSKECRLQCFELAEWPGNQVVVEAEDEASLFEGIDGLKPEGEILGCVQLIRSNNRNSSGPAFNHLELVIRQDSIGEVSQVLCGFGSGGILHGEVLF